VAKAIVSSKRCSQCRECKTKGEFYKNRSKKDGLNSYCRVCWKAKIDKVVRSGRHDEYVRKWQKTIRDDPKRWAIFLERQRNYRRTRKPPERPASRMKRLARQKAHYRANKTKYVNRVRARELKTKSVPGAHTQAQWSALCRLFGKTCLRCGERKRLTRDHVTPLARGGSDGIENIQPLCLACNKTKFTKHIDYRLRWKVRLKKLNEVARRIYDLY
jgi:hypothetical protein